MILQKQKENIDWCRYHVPHVLDPKKHIAISRFDGGAGVEWIRTSGAGTGTVSDESVIYESSNKSIKVATSVGSNCNMRKTMALDLSTSTHINLRVYVPSVTDLSGINLQFSNDNFATKFFNYISYNTILMVGWNTLSIPKSVFTNTGGASWAAIDKVGLITLPLNGSVATTVYYDNLYGYNGELTRATVIFTFDDGLATVYSDARRILDKYQMAGTVFVVPIWAGTANYMTTDQLRSLQNQHNWDIGNHTYNHIYPGLASLTAAQQTAEIENCQTWLKGNGLRECPAFCYPYGSIDTTARDTVSRYFTYARGTKLPLMNLQWPFGMPLNLHCRNMDGQTLSDMTTAVDNAITDKAALVFYGHGLGEVGGTTAADFTSLVDYIAARDVDVFTFSQLIKKYS